ncbi:phytanoyl-CoA dioxygenase family protein [Microbispora amethystogenes]|uniref:phytanoyl-CoA dioxygenase family protein n=1 Tax=Microbispora amethystogenes TaxID=1427754 RepID=UPI0033BFCF7C
MTGLDQEKLSMLRTEGFCLPVDLLLPEEAAGILQEVRRYEELATRVGGVLGHNWTFPKSHLVAGWADRLVHDGRVLAIAEQVLGPDLLVWATSLFLRKAGSPGELAWHQDAPYYGWEEFDGKAIRMWIALTDTDRGNGTMRYAPRTHRSGLLSHSFRGSGVTALMRGEEVEFDVDDETALDVTLTAGQCSLHLPTTIHSSGPNASRSDRVCFAIDFIRPGVRLLGGRDSALLVRGADMSGRYELESRPAEEFGAAALKAFSRATGIRHSRMAGLMRAGRDPDARAV